MSENSQTVFVCKKCDYNTSRKNDYEKYKMTSKHKNDDMCLPVNIVKTRLCDCGKTYSCKQSLYVHKKKCNGSIPVVVNEKPIDEPTDANMILQLIKQNQDFKDLIVEQNKTILEAMKHNNNTNNSNNTVNSNNKTFNLQVFLNEDCKDAMNITVMTIDKNN